MINDLEILRRLSILLVISTLVIVVMHFAFNKVEIITETELTFVIEEPVSNIAGIAIKNENGQITIINVQGKLQAIKGDDALSYDLDVLQSIYYELCNIPSQAVFTDAQVDMSKALAVAIYIDSSGNTNEYTMASVRGPSGGYYIQKKGSQEIHLVSETVGKRFELSELDLQSKAVLPTINIDTVNEISTIGITNFNNPENSYTVKISNVNDIILYNFESPLNNRMDMNIIWEQLLLPISRLYGENVLYELAGIDEPDYMLSVTMGGVEHVVYVKKGDKEAYVYSEDKGKILTIALEKVEFLAEPYENLLNNKVYSVPAAYLDKILIKDDRTLSIKVIQREEDLYFEYNDLSLSYKQNANRLNQLLNIPIKEKLTGELSEDLTTELTIEYYYKNGVVDKIELMKSSSSDEILVSYNDQIYFTTHDTTIEDLLVFQTDIK